MRAGRSGRNVASRENLEQDTEPDRKTPASTPQGMNARSSSDPQRVAGAKNLLGAGAGLSGALGRTTRREWNRRCRLLGAALRCSPVPRAECRHRTCTVIAYHFPEWQGKHDPMLSIDGCTGHRPALAALRARAVFVGMAMRAPHPHASASADACSAHRAREPAACRPPASGAVRACRGAWRSPTPEVCPRALDGSSRAGHSQYRGGPCRASRETSPSGGQGPRGSAPGVQSSGNGPDTSSRTVALRRERAGSRARAANCCAAANHSRAVNRRGTASRFRAAIRARACLLGHP